MQLARTMLSLTLSLAGVGAVLLRTEVVHGSSPASDVVVGKLKGMVDSYLAKYDEEQKNFGEKLSAMNNLIASTADQEAKARAIDEKARLRTEHEEKLGTLVGFMSSLSQALRSMGGQLAKDVEARLAEIEFPAEPLSLLAHARADSADGADGRAAAEKVLFEAETYLNFRDS
mmetsp:Transcript_15467/g.34060  ORF Transcript_15467/g.34060 Transcript_15467/m.34060 type:complete len:173 (-) Transcript_15467:74-592(-)